MIKNESEELLPAPEGQPDGSVIEIEFRLGDLRKTLPEQEGAFDRVFHDPFSPQHVPELWTVELFREYYRLLEACDGRLLTYSAAAAVRGGLQEAGFKVGKTVGVGDKTGGTAAWSSSSEPVPPSNVQALDTWEEAYLNSRAGLPYRDPDLTSKREDIQNRRLAEQSASLRPSGEALRKQKESESL